VSDFSEFRGVGRRAVICGDNLARCSHLTGLYGGRNIGGSHYL
jgi:hypothetical protein